MLLCECSGVTQLTHFQCSRLKRRHYWVPDLPLTSSWPCKKTLTPSFPALQDSSAGLPLICGSGVWCLQVPASYKRHILMGLPLLCLIAVCTPTPHPDLRHHTHPRPLRWPLANPSYSGFRVRAADSQPIGRLPRGADAAVSSGRDTRDPGTQKRREAAVCLQHLRFREGRSFAPACTEHDERVVQYINTCHIKRSVILSLRSNSWVKTDNWNVH